MLAPWLLLPVVLVALSAGSALAVERASGLRIPGPLLIPTGLATVIVVAQLATSTAATAKLAAPLAVLVASLGLVLGRRRIGGLDGWAALTGAVVLAAFAAPVALSGEPTFAGFAKLDDTATWFGLTDRVMEHGRSLDGLAPSTYEATLAFNLADGYPVGALLPLGIGARLVGQDVAWTFQPYLAVLAAGLALCLYALAAPLVRSRPLRAGMAMIAAQAALLFGYSLWGGVKELAGALLVALVAALAATSIADRRARGVLPLAIALAATVSALSPAGAIVWVGPPLLAALAAAAIRAGVRVRIGRLLALGVATAVLTVPWLLDAGFLPPTSSPLTSGDAEGNLLGPLSPLQVAGVWPASDFRLDPRAPAIACGLSGAIAVAAALGIALAWRRRALAPLAYGAGAVAAAAATYLAASPWVAAKGLAIASPAILLLALAAIAALAQGRPSRPYRTSAATLLGAAIAAAVVWSNVLAYQGVSLAPAERYAELERVGEIVAGEGPTLMPEYDPYGARHFLRDGDPESVSELRRRPVELRGGGVVPKGRSVDLDQLAVDGVLDYRTLVVRRSPLASRPPSPYRLRWSGDHYEVWSRREGAPRVRRHLPLGDRRRPAEPARCADVLRLARRAGPRGRLAAPERPEVAVVPLDGTVDVSPPGRYELWVGGSERGRITVALDGEDVGMSDHELGYPGHYMGLGEVELEPGEHRLELVRDRLGIGPGGSGSGRRIGPLVLAPAGEDPRLITIRSSRARTLCGRNLDWVDAVRPR